MCFSEVSANASPQGAVIDGKFLDAAQDQTQKRKKWKHLVVMVMVMLVVVTVVKAMVMWVAIVCISVKRCEEGLQKDAL